MSERVISTRVAIAGGGPAGIMLGYLLARAGIDCVVLEKWPDFFRDFRGDTIHPSTMELLGELGLLEEFLRVPHNEMTRMTFHIGPDTVPIADFSRLQMRTPFIAFMPQWDFLTFLSAKAKQFPAFKLCMSAEATGLIQEEGRVAGLRAKDAEGEFDIRADLVVGADGRHSMVRTEGKFDIEELGVPIDVLWFRIKRAGADDKQSLGYLGAGGGLVMLDRGDYWQCAYIVKKGSFEAVKAAGLPAFRAGVTALAHLPASAMNEVDSWEKVKLLSVAVDHAREWAKPGAVLIGDAAHAMSPIGGVGINYAVQDAVAAANILVPALRMGGVPPLAVLQRIQARRAPPALKMQRLQVFFQNNVLSPAIARKSEPRMPWFAHGLRVFPFLQRKIAGVIGIGFLPEHIGPELFDSK